MQELILQIMISSDENVRSELTKLKYDIVAIILSIYIFFNYIRDIKGQTKKKQTSKKWALKLWKSIMNFLWILLPLFVSIVTLRFLELSINTIYSFNHVHKRREQMSKRYSYWGINSHYDNLKDLCLFI